MNFIRKLNLQSILYDQVRMKGSWVITFVTNEFSSGLTRTLKSYNNFVIHYPLLSMALTTGFFFCREDCSEVRLMFIFSKVRPWVWEVLFLKRLLNNED